MLMRFSLIVTLLSSSVFLSACDSVEKVVPGVSVNVVVPDPNSFPEIEPFDQCYYPGFRPLGTFTASEGPIGQ